MERARALGIDAIVSIGGDGSLKIARQLSAKGMRVVSVPKTIDNDVPCTVNSFGFDTAVSTVVEALDKLHTTAESHDRVMVCEVMGRDAGFIALYAGIAGTADVILIPELAFDVEKVCEKIRARERAGRRFSIVVAAEGAVPLGGDVSILGASMPGEARRVGGIAEPLAREINQRTGKESRSITLGHLQRGGAPTGYDRLLSARFGAAAVRAIEEERWGHMVALQSPHIVYVPVDEVLASEKRVELDGDILKTARELGIAFGD
jgi:6-phosphofructokinase 1